ncbi:MAG: PIN domain-containing protein [Clostridiales Family XIII bacterium]|nr:PIN domain-containing protein [Clostridiales Family XIII bacterium]
MTYALDTNILSYFIQGHEHVSASLRASLVEGHSLLIPPVAYYEIRRGFLRKASPAKERIFERICALYSIGEMNLSAWEQAARIHAVSCRTGKPMGDSDILIAAFCLVNGCTLVTNNTKHFEGIDGLSLTNWAEQPRAGL